MTFPPDAERIALRGSEDLTVLRRAVGELSDTLGLRSIQRTRVLTAASELGRNTVLHGGGGEAHVGVVREGLRQGIRLEFRDRGPGIPDLAQAMTDGYSTAGGLGLGLGGAARLLSDLEVDSAPGEGTRVTATMWT